MLHKWSNIKKWKVKPIYNKDNIIMPILAQLLYPCTIAPKDKVMNM